MSDNTRSPILQEWKKPFHDDVDTESERSDSGLITENLSKRWDAQKMSRPSFRLILEILLLIAVTVLSAILAADRVWHTSLPKRFGPSLPEKRVMFGNVAGFGPDLVYADNEMLRNATRLREVHENWQALFPKGRGYVVVDNPSDEFVVYNDAFNIDPDGHIGTVDGQGKGWILSVYHQIHCLSIITARLGIPHEEFATWDDYHLNHVSHCVEYLRQAILCNADTSLEGETGASSTSTGWGQMHVCKDFDALIKYGNEHASWDLSKSRVVDLHAPPGTTGKNKTGYGHSS